MIWLFEWQLLLHLFELRSNLFAADLAHVAVELVHTVFLGQQPVTGHAIGRLVHFYHFYK